MFHLPHRARSRTRPAPLRLPRCPSPPPIPPTVRVPPRHLGPHDARTRRRSPTRATPRSSRPTSRAPRAYPPGAAPLRRPPPPILPRRRPHAVRLPAGPRRRAHPAALPDLQRARADLAQGRRPALRSAAAAAGRECGPAGRAGRTRRPLKPPRPLLRLRRRRQLRGRVLPRSCAAGRAIVPPPGARRRDLPARRSRCPTGNTPPMSATASRTPAREAAPLWLLLQITYLPGRIERRAISSTTTAGDAK